MTLSRTAPKGTEPSNSTNTNSNSNTKSPEAGAETPISGIQPTGRSHAIATFLAGDTSLQILPHFNLEGIPLLLIPPKQSLNSDTNSQKTLGPFQAGIPITVPLYIATLMRRRQLCHLICPPWLTVPILTRVLAHETDVTQSTFSPELPTQYREIARTILAAVGNSTHSDSTEIPEAAKLKILLEDLECVRLDKIRRNIHKLSSDIMVQSADNTGDEDGEELSGKFRPLPIIDVTGMGTLEMHTMKGFLREGFGVHHRIGGSGRMGDAEKEEARVEADKVKAESRTAVAGTSNNRIRPRIGRRVPRTTPQAQAESVVLEEAVAVEAVEVDDDLTPAEGAEDTPSQETQESQPQPIQPPRNNLRRFR
mmetsp:Transcript_29228/g.35602  ORF Transcript_29228/g.35602 Transcript_29228/m.35602 type:complete len:366 (-) Transcript_29228:77-1174(-)